MTLTVGATHVVIGTGQFAIAQPVGLSIALAGIPGFVARDPGSPIVYHRVGRIAVGHVLGWQQPIDLGLVPQLVYPLAPEFTQLGYTLLAGVTATIGELVAPPVLSSSLMPWDRTPTVVALAASPAVPAGQSLSTIWTYTVPAGKKLFVSRATVTAKHYQAPTIAVLVQCYIQAAGIVMLNADCRIATAGVEVTDNLGAGPVVLLAGQTISALCQSLDASGAGIVSAEMFGFTFDA